MATTTVPCLDIEYLARSCGCIYAKQRHTTRHAPHCAYKRAPDLTYEELEVYRKDQPCKKVDIVYEWLERDCSDCTMLPAQTLSERKSIVEKMLSMLKIGEKGP